MRINLFIPALLVFTLLVSACAGEEPESPYDPAVAEQQITQALEESWDAMARQNLQDYRNYITSDWMLYTVMGNKIAAEDLFDIHEANITEFNIDMRNIEVHPTGTIAWVTYDGTISGLNQGESWGGEFIFTTVFELIDGQWLMVHKHESMSQ